MQKSAMCTKLNKQFASGFAVGSLFPFFCEVSFSLYGKSFFFARLRADAAQNMLTTGGDRDAAGKRCEHRRTTAGLLNL